MNCEKLPDIDRSASEMVFLDTCAALQSYAEKLSLMARPGMAIFLEGELGSGKTTFARDFIKGLAPGVEFDIPSPTFTLVQLYENTRIPVAHVDLYRISSHSEVFELGLEELIKSYLLIVEWPDRLPSVAWLDILKIVIAGTGQSRNLTIFPQGSWIDALERSRQIDKFIAQTEWRGARRTHFEGDASSRRYEIIEKGSSASILMDMPPRPDGPAIKGEKSYSQIARLAEDINAVVAINGELVARGFSAPQIYEADQTNGIAIMEDLGRRVFGRLAGQGEDLILPMTTAVDVLTEVASQTWPSELVSKGNVYRIGPYDQEAQLIEIDLLPSWFWPYQNGFDASSELNEEFQFEWAQVLPIANTSEPVWTMRDFHSPNLLWLPDRANLKRVGLIDTQDALLGHPAYDLVSLIQDARLDVNPGLAAKLFDYYCAERSGKKFNKKDFAAAYAVLGAQRATKILGIFIRLFKRDGKIGYLRHIPRVSRYLRSNLQHPALARLRIWYSRHLPKLTMEGDV